MLEETLPALVVSKLTVGRMGGASSAGSGGESAAVAAAVGTNMAGDTSSKFFTKNSAWIVLDEKCDWGAGNRLFVWRENKCRQDNVDHNKHKENDKTYIVPIKMLQ
jgi:hypothetical protein